LSNYDYRPELEEMEVIEEESRKVKPTLEEKPSKEEENDSKGNDSETPPC
jgi:hypothetical protein